MRNRTTPLLRFSAFLLRVTLLVPALLAMGAGVATAADNGTAQTAEAETPSFGLLGPVGLAAVALGVVGMALGVLRQRRKAQAEKPVETLAEPTTRPTLTPYRRSA